LLPPWVLINAGSTKRGSFVGGVLSACLFDWIDRPKTGMDSTIANPIITAFLMGYSFFVVSYLKIINNELKDTLR
jgi:hypothetical protein